MANRRNGTIYTGVTSNLVKRAYEHREGVIKGFSKSYNGKILMFYELHETMESAILREKQIKGGSRRHKVDLIEAMNPLCLDLYKEII